MNKEQLAEKAFKKWWGNPENCIDYGVFERADAWIGFDAAFDLLMPLLEKSLEANRLAKTIYNEDEAEMVEDKARQTLSEIEAALKEMEK